MPEARRPAGGNPEAVSQAGNEAAMYSGMPSAVTSPRFTVDSRDLVTLHNRLTTVIGDLTTLERKVESIAGKLSGLGMGGGGGVTGFSGTPGTKLTTAHFSGTGGSGRGSTNTAAPVTAGGGGGGRTGGAFALGALGEIAGQTAGRINTGMSRLQQGNLPLDLLARQVGSISGRPVGLTMGTFTGISNMSATDLSQGLSTLRGNAYLGVNLNQIRQSGSFLNTLQKLNPGLGAAGAASIAGQLASPQAMNMIMAFGGPNAGLVPLSGRGRQNNSAQVFKSYVTAATFGKANTAGAARSIANNPQQWAAVMNNLTNLGVPPDMISEIQQYMAAGNNLQAATPKNAVASSLLKRTTAGTRTGANIFEASAGTQNTINRSMTDLQNLTGTIAKANPIFSQVAVGGAAVAGSFLQVASAAMELRAVLMLAGGGKGALGLGGLGGGAGAGGIAGGAGAGGIAGMAKGLLGKLGIAGAIYGGSQILGSVVAGGQTHGARATTGNILGVAGKGAALGTLIEPGLGTLIGGALGGALGGAEKLFGFHVPGIGDPLPGPGRSTGMHPALASGLSAMFQDNPALQLNSGTRTNQEQAALYMLKGGKQVAPPGQSRHQTGLAADVGPSSQMNWIAANAHRYGLYNPSSSEPWHLEAMGDPSSSLATGSLNPTFAGQVSATSFGGSGVQPVGSRPSLGFTKKMADLGHVHQGVSSIVIKPGANLPFAISSSDNLGHGALVIGPPPAPSGSTSTPSTPSTGTAPGATPGAGASGGGGGGGSVTIGSRTAFSQAVLSDLGVDLSEVGVMNAWQRAEGGAGPQYGVARNIADYNPINVSLGYGPQGYGYDPGTGKFYPGARPTPGNNPPVAAFPSWAEGIQATVDRLKEPFASGILNALKAKGSLAAVSAAVVASGWGTGGFANISEAGDPMGARMTSTSSGPVTIHLNMPIQVVGVSQQDAKNLAGMVVQEIQRQTSSNSVAGS